MNVAILLKHYFEKNRFTDFFVKMVTLKSVLILLFLFVQPVIDAHADIQTVSKESQEIVAVGNSIPKISSQPISAIPTKTWVAQVLMGLLLVVVLIFLLAKFAKKYNLAGISKHNESIKLLSHLSVGIKERIAVVEVDNKQLLLGITPHSINTLHVFELNKLAREESLDSGNIKKIIVPNLSNTATQNKPDDDLFSAKNILRCAMSWVAKNKSPLVKGPMSEKETKTVLKPTVEPTDTQSFSFNNIYAFELNKNKDSNKD